MTNVNNMVLPVFQTVLLITILVLVILNYTTKKGFQNREGFQNSGGPPPRDHSSTKDPGAGKRKTRLQYNK
jgi:hypothetical protein